MFRLEALAKSELKSELEYEALAVGVALLLAGNCDMMLDADCTDARLDAEAGLLAGGLLANVGLLAGKILLPDIELPADAGLAVDTRLPVVTGSLADAGLVAGADKELLAAADKGIGLIAGDEAGSSDDWLGIVNCPIGDI